MFTTATMLSPKELYKIQIEANTILFFVSEGITEISKYLKHTYRHTQKTHIYQ